MKGTEEVKEKIQMNKNETKREIKRVRGKVTGD